MKPITKKVDYYVPFFCGAHMKFVDVHKRYYLRIQILYLMIDRGLRNTIKNILSLNI